MASSSTVGEPGSATTAPDLAGLATDAADHQRRADYLRALRRAYAALDAQGGDP